MEGDMNEHAKSIDAAYRRAVALVARELTVGAGKADAGELSMLALTALFKQAEDLLIQADRVMRYLPDEEK